MLDKLLAVAYLEEGDIHMDKSSLSHTSWDYKYHIIFIPKYREQIVYGKLKQDIGKTLRDLCEREDINIIEAECYPDHTHILLEIPPEYSIPQIMGYLKGENSLIIFDRHASLEYKYGSRHFWYREYYVDTARKDTKKIQDHIKNQLREDCMANQVSMREFIDPSTDEPVNKGEK